MVAVVTITENNLGTVRRIKFAYTADASGSAGATTTEYYNGDLVSAMLIPTTGSAPSDNYDVLINDADSVDVLGGLGGNSSCSANDYFTKEDGLLSVVDSQLTLAITNAGNATLGTVIIDLR
jgi:hypothetical protein